MRDLSRHAESSHERSVQGTRAANSVAVGEIQSRSHAEGESESAYESASRTIENKNRCHAVTYLAYQLVKSQTIRFRIKSVLRRVKDPAANTAVDPRPLRPNSQVAVLPSGLLATDTNRLDIETTARTSAAANRANVIRGIDSSGSFGFASGGLIATPIRTSAALITAKPVTVEARAGALKAVDEALVKAGVLDKVGGDVSSKLQAELAFERTTCLPTQAIVVKGCLDKCSVCEPAREREIELDLERKSLENDLLRRQIQLLEKSQEYRCCPEGHVEESEEDEDDDD